MRGFRTVPLVVFLWLAVVPMLGQQSPYALVNPFIGTGADGNTFPAATLPFGMLQWGPDTRADGWYRYGDKTLRGFSLTHISGAGCPVYADVPMLPWTGEIRENPATSTSYGLPFAHEKEEAHPGYYAVETENGVRVELTAGERAGLGRFEFPAGADRKLLIEAGNSANAEDPRRQGDSSTVEIVGQNTVRGTVHSGGFCESDTHYTLHFVIEFDRAIVSMGGWDTQVHPQAHSASGHKAGVWVGFGKSQGAILARVGISFVSQENAMQNLRGEISGWDFEGLRRAAMRRWSETLGLIESSGGTQEQRVLFYTGFYHMLLSPNIFSDANGDYVGFDGKVRKLGAGEAQYANFSDWDIYRNVVQLHSLLFPKRTAQMMQSLVRDAEQSGWLPRWPAANDVTYVMGGDSSAILLSEAYSFGVRGFDANAALRFAVKGATQPGKGAHDGEERPWLAEYLQKGYVSLNDGANESAASNSLEYNSADFAASRLAAALGQMESADRLLRSSQNWRKLWDAESGFIRPRQKDGSFLSPWDPDHLAPHHTNWDKADQMGFEEGSTWQYTFMIPFDYAGLFDAMGGREKAILKLDKFFEKVTGWGLPNYTVANEPDFCAAYAYDWAGAPWKTQEVIDRIQREAFFVRPDGLPGNDDLGATSGVYVWNALGFYPVIPGVGGLALGTPMFSHTIIHFGDGRSVEVRSEGKGIYVQHVKLNGKEYASSWLPLSAFSAQRNVLEFYLGEQPNKQWGAGEKELPPSWDLPAR